MPCEVLIASVTKSLFSVTTTDTTYPIVKLYKFREEEAQEDGTYKYKKAWPFTTGEFKRIFFPNGYFTMRNAHKKLSSLSTYHQENDIWNSKSHPNFNLYKHVLGRWDNSIPIHTWDTASQIFIRRDLNKLNNLKEWYGGIISYQWKELLKAFDREEGLTDKIGNEKFIRLNSGRLHKGDTPVLSITYTNENTKLKDINVRIYFEIV